MGSLYDKSFSQIPVIPLDFFRDSLGLLVTINVPFCIL